MWRPKLWGNEPPKPDKQPVAVGVCQTNNGKTPPGFAKAFNSATTAYQAGDNAGALNAIELARPHAVDDLHRSAILQLEIGIRIAAGAGGAAIPLLSTAMVDPCVQPALPRKYMELLQEFESKGSPAPQH